MATITTRELKERLQELQGQEVTLLGWIRNHRKQKNMGFVDFFDGTCFKNPQVVYDNTLPDFETVQALRVGSAVKVTGKVVPSYKDPETPEIQASAITLEGDCPEDYPLQPKRHTGIPAGNRLPASADPPVPGRVPCAERCLHGHPHLFPGQGLRLRSYSPDHRQ